MSDGEGLVTPHLWEVAHPYYATEGNFYNNDSHLSFDSWADFKEDGSFDADRDMNLLYRWDWEKPDPDDYATDLGEVMPDHDTLKLFFVGQRKAIHRSEAVVVTEADEAEVRAWLTECAETIAAIWAPIRLEESDDQRLN